MLPKASSFSEALIHKLWPLETQSSVSQLGLKLEYEENVVRWTQDQQRLPGTPVLAKGSWEGSQRVLLGSSGLPSLSVPVTVLVSLHWSGLDQAGEVWVGSRAGHDLLSDPGLTSPVKASYMPAGCWGGHEK